MHRAAVLELLRAHGDRPLSAAEASAVGGTISFVESHADCLLRSCVPGHLTGSAWVVSPERRRTLLTLHRKLGKWLQLGGHADGDPDLLRVALREAREESGLSRLAAADRRLFDVDRHWIPESAGAPGHWHYDLRFMFEAEPSAPLTATDESRELSWFEVAAVSGL
ncbi:MAG TPA: NUDIX hydrolase, partial [Opitutaceae bacterium]|nr:NUDIX hydrolase [Opitutaceae bacterium]